MSLLKADINEAIGLSSDIPIIFLVEKINSPVTVNRTGDQLFLEGICAEFGIENNNKRVYEKEEYLPHLEYLNEKISRGNLYGELDHPQNYDITLKNVSHIIERLAYDPASNSVKIKIRVLDTPMGKIVKSLVESGCIVSISSRAAGQILNEGKVKLHKIFTYDIVGEAGFQKATLGKVFESAGYNNFDIDATINLLTENEKNAITNQMIDVSESLHFPGLKAYAPINKVNESKEEDTNKNNSPARMAEQFVKVNEFQDYSKVIKKKFTLIKENLEADKKFTNGKLKQYLNYLANKQNQIIEKLDDFGGSLDKNIRYTEHVSEKLNHSINYSNYIKEMLNFNINFADGIASLQNKQIAHSNLIAEKLNFSINHSDHVAGVVNNVINHNNKIATTVNEAIDYGNMQAGRINEGIAYSEHIGGILEKYGKWSDALIETLESGYNPVVDRTQKILDQVKQLDESVDIKLNIDEKSSVQDISESVNKVLDLVQNMSADKILESQYPFLKFLNKKNKEQFYSLDTGLKGLIVDGMKKAVWTNESEVVNIMNNIVAYAYKDTPNHVRYMPAEYKEVYEAMTEEEKTYLGTKASNYVINTPYQAKSFWDSFNFFAITERIKNKNTAPLNESQGKEGFVTIQQVADLTRGYSQDYVDKMNRYINR